MVSQRYYHAVYGALFVCVCVCIVFARIASFVFYCITLLLFLSPRPVYKLHLPVFLSFSSQTNVCCANKRVAFRARGKTRTKFVATDAFAATRCPPKSRIGAGRWLWQHKNQPPMLTKHVVRAEKKPRNKSSFCQKRIGVTFSRNAILVTAASNKFAFLSCCRFF